MLQRLIHCRQEKGSQNETQRTPQCDALTMALIQPIPFDTPVQILPDKVEHCTVADMYRQVVQQELVIDRGIVRLHIGLEDEAMLGQRCYHLAPCIYESSMAFEMGTARREQHWFSR